MTTRNRVLMLGVAVMLGAVWYCWMTKVAVQYQEIDATWRIQGVCKDAQTGTPIVGAQVIASFREPIAFKHHWRNPPPLATTDVVKKTDDQGRFEITGGGGSVYIRGEAKGYCKGEPWDNRSYRALDGITRVDTNVVLKLEPILRTTQE